MRSSIVARILGFRQRIIPEPRVPSRGSQAQGTRLPPSWFHFFTRRVLAPESSIWIVKSSKNLRVHVLSNILKCLTIYSYSVFKGLAHAGISRRKNSGNRQIGSVIFIGMIKLMGENNACRLSSIFATCI